MANTTPAMARIWAGLQEKYENDAAPLRDEAQYWYRRQIDYDERDKAVISFDEVLGHVEFTTSQVTERYEKNLDAQRKIPRMIAVNYDIMKLPKTDDHMDAVAASMFYILYYLGTEWTTLKGSEDKFKKYMRLNWDTYANITSHGNYDEDDMVYQLFRISEEFHYHSEHPQSQAIEWRSLYPEYEHIPGQYAHLHKMEK
jgi:hypothetical protein